MLWPTNRSTCIIVLNLLSRTACIIWESIFCQKWRLSDFKFVVDKAEMSSYWYFKAGVNENPTAWMDVAFKMFAIYRALLCIEKTLLWGHLLHTVKHMQTFCLTVLFPRETDVHTHTDWQSMSTMSVVFSSVCNVYMLMSTQPFHDVIWHYHTIVPVWLLHVFVG